MKNEIIKKEIEIKKHYPKINLRENAHIARMLDETDCMCAYVNHHKARKQVGTIDKEKDSEDEVAYMEAKLDSKKIYPYSLFSTMDDISLEKFPEGLNRVVKYIAHSCGWNYLSVLLFILLAISAAIRGRYIGKINDTWQEAITLYVQLCAESGNMKSTLLKMVMQPHFLFEERKQKEYLAQTSRLQARAQNLRQAKKFAENMSVKLHGEGLEVTNASLLEFTKRIENDRKVIDKNFNSEAELPFPMLFTEETSFPKLYAIMHENGGGSTFVSAEGNTFLHLINGARAPVDIFTKAYDNEKFTTARKQDGIKCLPTPFLNIGLVVNPDIARQVYSNDRLGMNGLSPRFMICFGGKSHRINDDPQNKTYYFSYMEKIEALLGANFTQEADRAPIEIPFTEEAKRVLFDIQNFFEKKQHRIPKGQTHYRAHIRKRHGWIARIATLLHIWRYQEPQNHLVSKDDVLSAEYLANNLASHSEYAFAPDGLRAYYDAQKILDWIVRHRHLTFTSTDAAQGIENMKKENIFPALDSLERCNIISQYIVPHKARKCLVHKDLFMNLPC